MDFDVEPHSNCSYDYVALYDGISEQDPLIGKRNIGLRIIGLVHISMKKTSQYWIEYCLKIRYFAPSFI